MPTIEEFDDDMDFDLPEVAPLPAASSRAIPRSVGTSDPDAASRWTILYPIYLDAKRPKKTGQRRVGKEHAVEWPLAREMAQAAASLGFKVHLENNKRHPADWENPGRVRVLLKNSKGKSINLRIPNRSALLKQIGNLHPKIPSTAHITQRLPSHSPAISHGILQNAVDEPSSLMPPGMEGLAGPKPTPAAPTTPAIEPSKPESNSSKKKGKQKVKIIRR